MIERIMSGFQEHSNFLPVQPSAKNVPYNMQGFLAGKWHE
jgi:hypothetical protein